MKKYRRYYTTKQRSTFDCGITCMLNVLRYHGKTVSRADFKGLLDDAKIVKGGASMWDLIKGIGEHGLEAQGVVCDLAMLAQENVCPAIMVVEVAPRAFHYIVAMEVCKETIVVVDPSIWAARVNTMPLHKFAKRYHWHGEAILIS